MREGAKTSDSIPLQAEAHKVVRVACSNADAQSDAAVLWDAETRAATQYKRFNGTRAQGIDDHLVLPLLVIPAIVTIAAPLPDITAHVMQPERIGILSADRMGFFI